MNLQCLVQVRRRPAQHRLTARLVDARRSSRHLEIAYAQTDAHHQAGLPPAQCVLESV
jgi:hypothetical protein